MKSGGNELQADAGIDGLRKAPNGVEWIAVPGWERFEWLWHGFSTRRGGVSTVYGVDGQAGELNLGFTAQDTVENVRQNRSLFVQAVTGGRDTPCAMARQIHSCRSAMVDALLAEAASGAIPHTTYVHDVDGLMTLQAGILVGIQIADCIPVLVVDPVRRAVAGFHAGWRGTVERIVELGVAQMEREFGSVPGDMAAAIGPGIRACCYTVGEEVRARFEANFLYSNELFADELAAGGGLRLDLIEANRRQLLSAGLREDAIRVVGGCTACRPEWFYSHRRSGGQAGRMMAAIGIRG